MSGPSRVREWGGNHHKRHTWEVRESITSIFPLAPQMAFSFALQRLQTFPHLTWCAGRLRITIGTPGQRRVGERAPTSGTQHQINNGASCLLQQQLPHNSKKECKPQNHSGGLACRSACLYQLRGPRQILPGAVEPQHSLSECCAGSDLNGVCLKISWCGNICLRVKERMALNGMPLKTHTEHVHWEMNGHFHFHGKRFCHEELLSLSLENKQKNPQQSTSSKTCMSFLHFVTAF